MSCKPDPVRRRPRRSVGSITFPRGDSRVTEWRDRESFQELRGSELGRFAVLLAAAGHPEAYWPR
jgi:hypothetical protein